MEFGLSQKLFFQQVLTSSRYNLIKPVNIMYETYMDIGYMLLNNKTCCENMYYILLHIFTKIFGCVELFEVHLAIYSVYSAGYLSAYSFKLQNLNVLYIDTEM